jgi:hypothetical protein
MTFPQNHRDAIAAMDFFVVPTVTFRLVYGWFVIDHDRRRILHFDVTANPAAARLGVAHSHDASRAASRRRSAVRAGSSPSVAVTR